MSLKYEVRYTNYRIVYCRHGQRHQENGPAEIWATGNKEWYQNGNLHREDGPAVEWADGDKAWYQNGKLHRVNGPAIDYKNDYKEWWINGIEFAKEEYESEIRGYVCI